MDNMKINLEKIYDNLNEDMNKDKLIDARIPKNIVSSEEKELCIFLYTIFQYYLEKAIDLMNQDDSEKKEKAKKILNSLIENSFVNLFKSNKIIYSCLNGILNFYLGLSTFGNEDQSECEKYMLKSLDYFNTLPTMIKIRYVNFYQEIYNNLGIVFYNKGEIKKGLQYLGKSEQMYKMFSDLTSYNITNNFSKFMLNCSKGYNTNDSSTDKLEFFNFFIDGGFNKKNLEHNYTLTIFYYAQAFTRLGFRKKAIKYCSLTLKRQIEQNEYDLKDTIVNCINLAEFYMENQHFAQAEYVLISATSLLPDDLTKKKKLRASLHMQLGRYFLERLKFAVKQTKEQLWITENEDLYSIVNKRIVTFNTLNIVWPKIEDVRDIEQAKLLFRLSNTQLKKALQYYVLDGHVTDYITINKEMSQLYKYLTFFETDSNRIFAMLDRRKDILEPIVAQINPKAYIGLWQELILEIADIYNESFHNKFELLRSYPKQISEINTLGEKALLFYKQLLNYIEPEFKKAQEKTLEDLTTIVTIKLNMARIYTKLTYKDNKKIVSSMVSALKIYEEVYNSLKKNEYFKMSDALHEHMNICEEMINLLPSKINKINNDQE